MNARERLDLTQLFERARRLPPEEQALFLNEACEGDSELRSALDELLACSEQLERDVDARARRSPPKRSQEDTGDAEPAPGRSVGRYLLLECLGRGGMGIVYKAHDPKLGRHVALKFLPPLLGSDEEAKRRFVHEARAASALDHPNVCAVHDIDETVGGRMFISMAYCDGESLRDALSRGPLPVSDALGLAAQVAAGLSHAHDRGIIHRDIKASNVMLTRAGVVKIVDFGLAKLSEVNQTKPGTIFGTAEYMSPEQIRGEEVDHTTDVWSLGVLLYEMLTGKRPFSGEYYHAVMYSVLNEEPPSPAVQCPDIPLQLTHLIGRLLEKRRDKRYQRASDVARDLAVLQDRRAARSSSAADVWTLDDWTRAGAEPVASAGTRADSEAHLQLRVLVVDDEPEIELLIRQKFLKRIKAREWTFVFATDGVEAMERLDADRDIALVLTDLRMPGMDGLSLLRRLSRMDRPLKSVVISAYGDMDNIRTAMNLGAFDFVTKPINLADLEATIRKSWNELLAHKQTLEMQRQLLAVSQELEVARRIQDAMLPAPFSTTDRVDVYAFTARAPDVRGDFYDYFVIDDDRVGFFAGDVSSRGISAALFSTMALVFLKGSMLEGRAPGDSLGLLNRLLRPEGFPELSASIFIGILDLRLGTLSHSCAGLPPPLVAGDGEPAGTLDTRVQRPVWEQRDATYESHVAFLRPGQKLLIYTDGVREALDDLDDEFTRERLVVLLNKCGRSSAAELIRTIVRDVMDCSADMPLSDDFTLLALHHAAARPGS